MHAPTQRLELIEEQLRHAEAIGRQYRNIILSKLRSDHWDRIRAIEEQDGTLAPLPPRLPRAEYVLGNDTINRDHESLLFYLACEDGILPEVMSFFTRHKQVPSQAVLQYGLELATFACKPAVVRYLLDKGAILHSGCFMRSKKIRRDGDRNKIETVCIFDLSNKGTASTDDFISLLSVFIDSKIWHPNQPWMSPTNYHPYVAIIVPRVLADRKLLEFLLEHGADPNLDRYPKSDCKKLPASVASINRAGSRALNFAAASADLDLFELFIKHGAKVESEDLHLLHSLVRMVDKQDFATERRPLAEYFLRKGLVDINEVKKMPWRHDDPRLRLGDFTEDETPLSRACAASDWEYVEWLIQNGADPDALNGKARTQQWWMKPHDANDPLRLQKILDKTGMNNK